MATTVLALSDNSRPIPRGRPKSGRVWRAPGEKYVIILAGFCCFNPRSDIYMKFVAEIISHLLFLSMNLRFLNKFETTVW